MAKLKMKYIEIAAPIEQGKDIFDFLQMRSVIELHEQEETEGLDRLSSGRTVSQFEKYMDTAQTALSILDKYAPQKKGLLASFEARREISVSEYIKKSDMADKMLAVCYNICCCEKTIAESKAGIARLRAAMDGLEPWLSLDVPMQFSGTQTTAAFIGTLPGDFTAESLLTALAPALEGEERLECEIVSHGKDRSCIFVVCHRECKDKVYEALRTLGFAYPTDPTKHPPRVRYERSQKQIEDLTEEIKSSEKEIVRLASNRSDIEFVRDYFSVRHDKYEALNLLSTSESVIIISGYVPEKRVDALVSQIEEKFTAAVSVTDPPEDADVPVLLENNSFNAPMESITAMYALPAKADPDPSPIMSFFYYFFFGLMLSDAGYGLLMVLFTFIAKKKLKLEENMKKNMNLFFYCGISTMFWGAMFGGWFGDIIPVVANNFFGKNLTTADIAIWMDPLEGNNPMTLLLFSFLFGICHLYLGLAVRLVMLWKEGKRLDAICDTVPVYLLVTGVAPICANMIAGGMPQVVLTVGKYLAIAGVIAVILTSGRSSKSLIGKLGGGLYGLYNVGSGYLGDVLSYSRLLALSLCTGVIAQVVNMLGTIPSNPVVKAVLLVFVFIVGHTINIAINMIGTYVHTNRLQYVELYSKFYEGGGRAFAPLTANTKYFKLKEEK